MDKLLLKFEKELKPGTMVISIDFPFTHKTPKKVIKLEQLTHVRGRQLYIYKF